MPEATPAPVRVWDLPTRVFHWTLAVAVSGSLISAKAGALTWHFRFGYVVLALVAFRLLWGFVGGRWSRFTSFVYTPGALLRYLRGHPRAGEHLEVGHSPSGALSVFALLVLLALQLATGLVADDEIANLGPLNRYVEGATAASATSWHKTWGQWLLFGFIGLHLAGIAYYLVRKRVNLVGPMLSGDKPLPATTPASADGPPQRLLAALLLALCAGIAVFIARLGH